MKKILLVLIAFFLLLSCSIEDKFKREFDNCLTTEQVDLILQINYEFDEFVTEKHPENTKDLNEAYYFMVKSMSNKGHFSDYIYSNEKLLKIKKQLIKTGLFNQSGNNGNYLKCMESVSLLNNEVKDVHNVLLDSGHYSLSLLNLKLGILTKKNEIQSISKILLTFEFVLGQFEGITKENK